MGSILLRFLGVLTAGVFAAYLVALSPHLVHHLFDENRDRAACPYAAQSQQTLGLQPDAPSLTPLITTERLEATPAQTQLPSPTVTTRHPRAPPHPAPSA